MRTGGSLKGNHCLQKVNENLGQNGMAGEIAVPALTFTQISAVIKVFAVPAKQVDVMYSHLTPNGGCFMPQVALIKAETTNELVSGGSALLICAYDSDEKFRKVHLKGAISLSEFDRRSGTIPKNTELIFY